MKNKRGNLVAVLLILYSSLLYAQQNFHLEIEPILGMKDGMVKEYVYNDQYTTDKKIDKISELDWDLNKAFYSGIKTSLYYKDFSFSFYGAKYFDKDSGSMTDSDWLNSSDRNLKTCFSKSDNHLKDSFFLGTDLYYSFPITSFFTIKTQTGLEFEHLNFLGDNTTGWYSPNNTTSWDSPSSTKHGPDYLKTLTYKRNSFDFSFGLHVLFNIKKLIEFDLYGEVSPVVYFESLDFHELRNTYFLDDGFEFFDKFKFGGSITYSPIKLFSFKTQASYSIANFFQGNTTSSSKIDSFPVSVNSPYKSYSGFSHQYLDLSLSVIYRPF